MEQTDDSYNIAETTVGKFRFYEVALCENFLNIVSRWGRADEEGWTKKANILMTSALRGIFRSVEVLHAGHDEWQEQ